MSYKSRGPRWPDESVLISWLYGELDEVEKAKVEKYFQENPEKLQEMQHLAGVKDIMSNVQDKEVIAPPLFMDDEVKIVPIWKTSSFRTIATIAASFLLIIVVGKVLGTEIRYDNGSLLISFGRSLNEVSNENGGLTAMQVQQMIDNSNLKNQQAVDDKLAANRTELDSKIQAVVINNASMEKLAKQLSTASKDEIRTFVATLHKEQLTEVRDYLQLSASDQRKYTDNLIVEFSKYLQEQRNQDLNMFQTRFSKLEQHTDELKTETEQILASIISNSPQVQQSSY
jgi:hypothetical protein